MQTCLKIQLAIISLWEATADMLEKQHTNEDQNYGQLMLEKHSANTKRNSFKTQNLKNDLPDL